MFNHVGAKLKGLAKVVAWIGIILSCILGIVMMTAGVRITNQLYGTYGSLGIGESSVAGGLLTIVIGSLASWLSSLGLYGFGELIEKTTEIADKISSLSREKS